MTDNLSQCLDRSLLSAAEGQELTKHVVTGLVEKRNDECFDLLWNQVMEKKKLAWGYCRACYAPERKVPSRYDSNGNEYFHSYPKLFYCQHYFDVVDYFVGNIKQRFDQPDYSIYIKLQNIILKASCFQDFWSELNSLEVYIMTIQFFPINPLQTGVAFLPPENIRKPKVF